MNKELYTWMLRQKQVDKKMLAVLVDPDKADGHHLSTLLSAANLPYIDLLLVGGSLLTHGDIETTLDHIKNLCDLPTVIFPGDADQISSKANALLLLSLISGRNSDLLIGKHVSAAKKLKQSNLEVIPTGYMLIDGGAETTASYVSATKPLPAHKPGIAAMTALAGEQLGLQLIYMDAGSGAKQPVSPDLIRAVRNEVELPIVVGGGIRNKHGVINAWQAGADIVVIGNALEKNPEMLPELHHSLLHG